MKKYDESRVACVIGAELGGLMVVWQSYKNVEYFWILSKPVIAIYTVTDTIEQVVHRVLRLMAKANRVAWYQTSCVNHDSDILGYASKSLEMLLESQCSNYS